MKRTALLLTLLFGTTFAGAQNLSGPYVGGYLAGGSADAHWDFSNGTKVDHSMSGGLGGVQGGYNWQPGSWLLGVQADLGVGNLSGSSRCAPPNQAFDCKTELLSLLTIRGRAGPVFNNFAPYVTAGIASAGIRTSVDNHANIKGDDLQGHAGWTAGAGVTGLISRHILWQAEYLRLNFGSEDHVMLGVLQKVKVTADLFRIGVHYKF
jgi:outer membrane immunogenic protein